MTESKSPNISKNVIAYLRVSTENQLNSGLGLEAQLAAITNYCASHNLSIPNSTQIFTDGLSGADNDRPNLIAALDALTPNSILLVAKRDRLARDVELSCYFQKLIRDHGAMFISAAGEGTGTGTDSDPASILMGRVIDAVSEHERLVIKKRTKDALHSKKVRGEITGTAPYGYMRDPSIPPTERINKNGQKEIRLSQNLIPNPAEQAALTHIRACRRGTQSCANTAAALNRSGFLTRRGTPWTAVTVHNQVRKMETGNREGKLEAENATA